MYAESRQGTPSVTSLPKDGGMSCFGCSSGRVAHPVSDRAQPYLTSIKLMELARSLGHSPRCLVSCVLLLTFHIRNAGSIRKVGCKYVKSPFTDKKKEPCKL